MADQNRFVKLVEIEDYCWKMILENKCDGVDELRTVLTCLEIIDNLKDVYMDEMPREKPDEEDEE